MTPAIIAEAKITTVSVLPTAGFDSCRSSNALSARPVTADARSIRYSFTISSRLQQLVAVLTTLKGSADIYKSVVSCVYLIVTIIIISLWRLVQGLKP